MKYNVKFTPVDGKDVGTVRLYALSTCVWCMKTRGLLDTLGVKYKYVYVDLLKDDERNDVVELIKKLNPNMSFPIVDVNGTIVVGFKEDELRELLKGD